MAKRFSNIRVYSKTCEHVLRLIGQMPKSNACGIFLARELCRKARVPEAAARKGLQMLVSKGLLKAVPGPGGGYAFAKDPASVTLLSVIEALDGKKIYDGCIMGYEHCDQKKPCSMHGVWEDLRGRLFDGFRKNVVLDMMKG